MNSICIGLRLTSPPESRFTPDSSKQFGVAIAVQEWEKNGQLFSQKIKITAWRDVDNFLTLQAGDLVLFDGTIGLRTVDKGAYKAKVAELNCNNFQVIGKGNPSTPKSAPVDFAERTSTPVAAIAPQTTATNEVPDYDDIPF